VPQLADIQSHLRAAIVRGDTAAIAPLLVGGRDVETRLAIHRRHYETSLVTALLGKFPATVWLVGTPFVAEAARHFVRECPPHGPCIAEYGEAFPQCVSTRPTADRVPYLREFERLATLPLLVMIAVIQMFVYPQAWTEHLLWASILVFLLTRGPGTLSVDYLVEQYMAFSGTSAPGDTTMYKR
jgi:hypothetical protein